MKNSKQVPKYCFNEFQRKGMFGAQTANRYLHVWLHSLIHWKEHYNFLTANFTVEKK